MEREAKARGILLPEGIPFSISVAQSAGLAGYAAAANSFLF
jgi:hypothetical protein